MGRAISLKSSYHLQMHTQNYHYAYLNKKDFQILLESGISVCVCVQVHVFKQYSIL